MNSNIKLPQRQLYLILIFCSIIIFLNCIEVMIKVKDIDLYEEWIDSIPIPEDSNAEDIDYYQLYITTNLSHFFIKIIAPMVLGIYSYFAFKRTRINKIYVYIWTILLLGNLVFILVEQNFGSIFFYINTACYIILMITLLSLNRLMENRGNS